MDESGHEPFPPLSAIKAIRRTEIIQRKVDRGKWKNVDLSTAIFIEDDDGSVATFSISSPSSAQRISTPLNLSQRRVDFDLVDGLSTISRPPQTPNSISTSAGSFARRLEQVASFSELAAANSSADPGVRASDGETSRLANHALTDDDAMIISPIPIGASRQITFSILTKFPLEQALALRPSPRDSHIRPTTNAWKISSASIILKSTRLARRIFLTLYHEKRPHLQRTTSWQIRPFLYMPIPTPTQHGPTVHSYLPRSHSRGI